MAAKEKQYGTEKAVHFYALSIPRCFYAALFCKGQKKVWKRRNTLRLVIRYDAFWGQKTRPNPERGVYRDAL